MSSDIRRRTVDGLRAGDSFTVTRTFREPDTPVPEVQLLSNGRYHVAVTSAGAGYSRWKDLAVTRWREDATCDNWGAFCYIRDVADGTFWSAGHQPSGREADSYEVAYSEDHAEFARRDLKAGLFARVAFSPATRETSLSIPRSALVGSIKNPQVFVV